MNSFTGAYLPVMAAPRNGWCGCRAHFVAVSFRAAFWRADTRRVQCGERHGTIAPMTMPPSRRPGRPNRLGRWEVIAKIAGGGMSAIYLGRRTEAPREVDDPPIVVLKIVRADLRHDAHVREMFLT